MDLADIEAELAEIDKRETFLSERIKNLLSEEQNLHKSFSSVSSVANELKGVDREVTTLHSKLEETSALSEKISKRVGIIFSRRFSSEKCPTLTVASFFFFFFSSDHRPHRVCTHFYRNW